MEENKKHIYVCISECKEVVKVGITYNLNSRICTIVNENRIPYKVLFCSELINVDEAKEVEKKINIKFKECVIKGKEWYKIKPITVIDYIIDELQIKPYELNDLNTEFPSWEETLNNYKAHKEVKEFPLIKEKPQRGIYCISYLKGSDIKYIGFCNYGDAKNFYFKYKHFVLMADELINILYNIPKPTFTILSISPKKEVYNIRKKIISIRENLIKITDIWE